MSKRIAMLVVALAIVLGSFSVMPPKQARAGYFNEPVLLIHGFNVNSGLTCDSGSMWGTVESFFNNPSRGYWNIHSLGFYNGDSSCWDYLGFESYHCTSWFDSGSNNGTVNENIYHLTCELAWYMWDHYTNYGNEIAVIAHSMGGILIRQAMFDTGNVSAFPPYLSIY